MNYELIAYAMDFTSFLLYKLGKDVENIKQIILFGSVARGETTEKSDVDIFIDIFQEDKKFLEKIDRIKEDFYESVKFEKFWKLLRINYKIKPMTGKLNEWKDLKLSIMANGIVLYGRYEKTPKERKRVILLWENVKPQSKRITINRRIFGYSYFGKRYSGLLQKFEGIKLGKGAIEIPIESYPVFIKIFRNYKVPVRIKYVIL